MELGQVVSGKYRLLRLLGDGGMGAVYEAHHEALGSKVAIKVLHDDLVVKPEIVDRFLQEARVLARISNPHVVRVLDLAVGGGAEPAYIVMELLVGEPLSALLRRERKVPIPRAVEYAEQVLEALAAAHALQVVHRDLKPENIFLTREGDKTVLKVIDFGIAKARSLAGVSANLTVSGALMGTPEYMAPEQAHSADRADARSDLFAVGVLLYEMISGARPVDGEDPRLVAMKVERGEVHPLIHRVPDVPRELAGLVHRAMAPRPELRFESAAEMKTALLAAVAPKRPSAPPPSVAHAGPPPGATQSAPAPRASWMPPAASSGTGTIVGGSAESRPSAAPGAGETDPGDAPLHGGPPPPVAGAEVGYMPPPRAYGQPPRPGRRGSSGMFWMVGTLVLLLGGGVALAFAFTGSAKKPVAATARPAPAPSDSASPAVEPSSSEVAIDTSIPPLPAGPTAVPKAITGPTPRASGGPLPPGPGVPPSASAGPLAPPFGLPPLFPNLLPSGLPNPFPTGAGSGVGPVITIPTAFPDFGFPTDPNGPPPAPSAAPRRRPPH
jgi:serine/threonine-protein kinase